MKLIAGEIRKRAALLEHGLLRLGPGYARAIERRHPPRGVFLRVPGGHLHAIERARRETLGRRPAILLHGASSNACDMGLDLLEGLARSRPTLAFDRPGHGWSDRPGGAADAAPDRQADLIRHALQTQKMKDVILVAHSWSGGLAINMALRHPDMVGGLVLVGAASHPWPGGKITWYHDFAAHPWLGRAFATLAPIGGAALAARAVEAIFAPQKPPTNYVERTALPLLFRKSQFCANSQDMAGLHAFLTRQASLHGALRTPTVALVSDADPIVPMEHSATLARETPAVELRVLNGLSHMLHHVAIAEIVEAVNDVSDRIDGLKRPRALQRDRRRLAPSA
jgi:pimeloyl-ACP methyl ester carboxylesterase